MDIVLYPDPLLRRKAEPVASFDDDLRRLAREMLATMYRARGVGLAAPQVGVSRRLFVMNPTGKPEDLRLEEVLVNPRVLSRRGEVVGEEGCLSLPGLYGEVARAEAIRAEAWDLEGRRREFEASGFPARIVQHEVDHLDGVLFFERLSPADRLRVKAQVAALEKRFREGKRRASPEEAEPEPVAGGSARGPSL